jgi:hypothetical protein
VKRLINPTFKDVCNVLGYKADDYISDSVGIRGCGFFQLLDEDGNLKELGVFKNLVTDVGDQYYAERGAGIAGAPVVVTGMKVGTGSTAAAKTGAGANIVTYVTAITASKAIDGGFPTSAQPGGAGTLRRIRYQTTYAPGEATNSALTEAVITNQTTLADTAGTAADKIARALLSSTVNKTATDTLINTWDHTFLGA